METLTMNFGDAITMARNGRKIARMGWNGKNIFVFFVGSRIVTVDRAPLSSVLPDGTEITIREYLMMYTVDGQLVPWVASQSDVLAHDWYAMR